MWLTSKETTGGKEGGQPEIGQACREGAAAGAEGGVESVSYAKAMDFCLKPGRGKVCCNQLAQMFITWVNTPIRGPVKVRNSPQLH